MITLKIEVWRDGVLITRDIVAASAWESEKVFGVNWQLIEGQAVFTGWKLEMKGFLRESIEKP